MCGFNYGQTRNRGESLKALKGVILEAIGDYDILYEKYDFQETAALINEKLDIVQTRYNKKYNFPNT